MNLSGSEVRRLQMNAQGVRPLRVFSQRPKLQAWTKSPKLGVVIVVEALDGRVLDGAVHAFDLAVRPGMFRLGQPLFDVELGAGAVEGMCPGKLALCDGFPDLGNDRTGAAGGRELDAPRHGLSDPWRSNGSIGKNSVGAVGDSGDKMAQEIARDGRRGALVQGGRSYSAAILITGSMVASTSRLRWHLIW